MTTQLELFEDSTTNGKRDLKPIDYTTPIGMYKEIAHIKGVHDLSERAMMLLHYLYLYHSRPEDWFIHAKLLSGFMGFHDTRELRKLCAEIDEKTELVVYASQNGYKLASTPREIEEAIRFALAPALTTLKRVHAKSKTKHHQWLHGYITNLLKEYGGYAQGQQQMDYETDEELNPSGLRSVDHYPEQPYQEDIKKVEDRIREYVRTQNIKRKTL